MRLIDADKLIKDVMELWDYKTVDGITATTVLKQTITDIENQPTVKAIPIEWIKKWCNKERNRKSLEERLLKRYGVITMLEDWEKENGEKTV